MRSPSIDRASISVAGYFWLPLGTQRYHSGDGMPRGLVRLILGGQSGHLRWTFNGGILLRQTASLGVDPPSDRVGHELQVGAALSYVGLKNNRLSVGPEASFATLLIENKAFTTEATSLEVLAGCHYRIADVISIGAGAGIGVLREPGTPDVRALLRIEYAPAPRKPPPPAA